MANNVSHIQINGFRIQGNNRNITSLIAATNQPGSCANPVGTADPIYNGVGININGRGAAATARPQHLWVRSCEAFEYGQMGTSAIQADYVPFENNLMYTPSARGRALAAYLCSAQRHRPTRA